MNHGKILSYLMGSLTLAEVREVAAAEEYCWHCQANLSTGSQVKAQMEAKATMQRIMDSKWDYEKERLNNLIKTEAAK